MRELSVPALLFYRFFGAAITGFLILAWQRMPWSTLRAEARLALGPGFFLAMTLIFQTYGLQGTSATQSAFITTTYIVFVPLLAHIFGLEKIPWIHWIWVGLACGGGFLTLDLSTSNWQWSQIFTCLNALAASAQILMVGQVARHSKSSLALNSWQALYVALLSLPFTLVTSSETSNSWNLYHLNLNSIVGLISLTWGSSFLAFLLQIRAQKSLKASTASLLFLLESPFSYAFAFLLLGEFLRPWQIAGAVLILLSCVATLWTEKPIE